MCVHFPKLNYIRKKTLQSRKSLKVFSQMWKLSQPLSSDARKVYTSLLVSPNAHCSFKTVLFNLHIFVHFLLLLISSFIALLSEKVQVSTLVLLSSFLLYFILFHHFILFLETRYLCVTSLGILELVL